MTQDQHIDEHDEASLAGRRIQIAAMLHEFGLKMKWQQIRNNNAEATDAQVDDLFLDWLRAPDAGDEKDLEVRLVGNPR